MLHNPRLFGLAHSNRDFSQKESWGKNQFNSSFPAALCCYLDSKNICANFLICQNQEISVSAKSIQDIFGISPESENLFFAFESEYSPFSQYVVGKLPRTDLVIQDLQNNQCLSAFEIKLTALPDNTTCNLSGDKYGCEIVIRPDSIVYLACSIAHSLKNNLKNHIELINLNNEEWTDPQKVIAFFDRINQSICNVIMSLQNQQTPFLLQPIWKTEGKSPKLAQNCLDVFVWSDIAFLRFMQKISELNKKTVLSINRQTRACIWLYKMLLEIVENGRFNHAKIINDLSFNTKNDKAFASSGAVTNSIMTSPRLTKPIIQKDDIKHIILGGGQELLSPERRFDAIIYNSAEIFV